MNVKILRKSDNGNVIENIRIKIQNCPMCSSTAKRGRYKISRRSANNIFVGHKEFIVGTATCDRCGCSWEIEERVR
jgi:hypothetical protein